LTPEQKKKNKHFTEQKKEEGKDEDARKKSIGNPFKCSTYFMYFFAIQ